jgi:hypothetical protein
MPKALAQYVSKKAKGELDEDEEDKKDLEEDEEEEADEEEDKKKKKDEEDAEEEDGLPLTDEGSPGHEALPDLVEKLAGGGELTREESDLVDTAKEEELIESPEDMQNESPEVQDAEEELGTELHDDEEAPPTLETPAAADEVISAIQEASSLLQDINSLGSEVVDEVLEKVGDGIDKFLESLDTDASTLDTEEEPVIDAEMDAKEKKKAKEEAEKKTKEKEAISKSLADFVASYK